MWEAGKVPDAAFENARAKAYEARITCGYDHATPKAGEGALIEDGLPSDDNNARENGGGDDAK